MTKVSDFQANGVEFVGGPRPDINELVAQIPRDGTLHLAILQQPYFDLINDGTKTIESRFNTKRAAPYGRVAVGDLILLKETGQPVTSYFFASMVESIDLSQVPLEEVRERHAAGICAQDEEAFWEQKASSRYCTLVGVGERGEIPELAVAKRDQRGWVTFTRQA